MEHEFGVVTFESSVEVLFREFVEEDEVQK
mgnify:CR=1 FL=1